MGFLFRMFCCVFLNRSPLSFQIRDQQNPKSAFTRNKCNSASRRFFRSQVIFYRQTPSTVIAQVSVCVEELKRDIPKTGVIPEKKYFLMQKSLLLLFYKAFDIILIFNIEKKYGTSITTKEDPEPQSQQ